MYRGAILNSDINRIAGNLGHTDQLCIADCGLPIPAQTEKVDLALKLGVPGFWEVLTEVADHLEVERITVAEEIRTCNAPLYHRLCERFRDIPMDLIPHEVFKQQTARCAAVIRTGEVRPYANIILHSGCLF